MLTGPCPLISRLVGRWGLAYLADTFGDCRNLAVHVVPRETRGFARNYGKGLGSGGVVPMSFRQFYAKLSAEHLPGAQKEALWKYYLQTPLVWFEEEKAAGGTRQACPRARWILTKTTHARPAQ